MDQLLGVAAALAGVFLVLGVVWLVAARLGLLKGGGGANRGTSEEGGRGVDGGAARAAYVCREGVLSPGERAFMPVLREALPAVAAMMGKDRAPLLLANVRLADVLEVDRARLDAADKGAWQRAFNALAQKHADFVLCDPVSTRPLLVVELDDASHGREDRRAADSSKDAACASAGLPVLRVSASGPKGPGYDARELAGRIAKALRAERKGAEAGSGAARGASI